MAIEFRKFKIGDEIKIENIIAKTLREVNIKDESIEEIEKLIEYLNKDRILYRAKKFHMYVICDNDKIIGVGAVGPYWDSLTEASLFNIFILPEYQGKGLGRKLIEILENDEYCKNANRIEVPASITGLEFYRHMGYVFKKGGNIVDDEFCYRLEKFPKISNDNNDKFQYNMRPFIDNKYHNYYEFVYLCQKEAYQSYIEDNSLEWNEEIQRDLFKKFITLNKDNIYIIQLNGKDIGFYNGNLIDDNTYEVNDIYINKSYQGLGIEAKILSDISEKYESKYIKIK